MNKKNQNSNCKKILGCRNLLEQVRKSLFYFYKFNNGLGISSRENQSGCSLLIDFAMMNFLIDSKELVHSQNIPMCTANIYTSKNTTSHCVSIFNRTSTALMVFSKCSKIAVYSYFIVKQKIFKKIAWIQSHHLQ